MLNRQIARLRLLGMLFCLAGGVAITIGWTGTAQVACVDCQIPYLLSGGAGGIALTVVGTGLLIIAQLRVEAHRIADQIASLSADGRTETAATKPQPDAEQATAAAADTAPLPTVTEPGHRVPK